MNWFIFTDSDGEFVAVNLAQCVCINFDRKKLHAHIYDRNEQPWLVTREDDLIRLRRALAGE
jgi:hypothetical protein